MEDEISIGEYVRTNNGIIDRIIIQYKGKCNNPNCNRKHISCEKNYYDEESIVKHSKDIKDLLQIGDIITTNNLCGEITKIDGNTIYLANYMGTCKVGDIQSIITKEQIKQIEFRIKE